VANPQSAIRNPQLKRLVPSLLEWFSASARDLPWRRTRDPYAIWVSEIMLQQTQVKTVMPYWDRWMRELPTIEALANASPEKIHKLWEGLGYYTRVRNMQAAAKQIESGKRKAKNGNAGFPDKFEDVLALPGIGRYTAGAICSIAFNQPTPILDGNVIRVLTRVFGIAENPKEKQTNALLWQIAEKLVSHASRIPDRESKSRTRMRTKEEDDLSCSHLNQSLMELGALICTPRNPQCAHCPVKKQCVAFKESRVNELPNLEKRVAATARQFIAFVVERDGKFLVRQRPESVVNAHLWEFPNIEIGPRLSQPQRAASRTDSGTSGSPGARSAAPGTGAVRRRRLPKPHNADGGSEYRQSDSVTDIATEFLGTQPASIRRLCAVKHSITRYRITLEAFHILPSETSRLPEGIWLAPSGFEALAFTAAHKKLASFAANCMLSDP